MKKEYCVKSNDAAFNFILDVNLQRINRNVFKEFRRN